MVRIPVGSSVFLPACRSRAILPTIVGLCFFVDPNLSAEPQRNLVFFLMYTNSNI